jgi:hypothetical protein
MAIASLVAALVVFAGPVAADAPGDQDVRTWTKAIQHTSNNGTLPLDVTVDVEPPHTQIIVGGDAHLSVTGYVVMSSASLGVRTGDLVFLATVDANPPAECNMHYDIPAGQDRQVGAVNIRCPTTSVTEGSSVRLQALVVTMAGGDPVEAWSFSFSWTQNDVIQMHTPTSFESLTGLTVFEFALFPALAFLGVILWSRAEDGAVRTFGAFLPMLAGAVLLGVAIRHGLGDVWGGTVGLAAVFFIIGVYLLIRFFLDQVDERRAAA